MPPARLGNALTNKSVTKQTFCQLAPPGTVESLVDETTHGQHEDSKPMMHRHNVCIPIVPNLLVQ